MGSVLRGLGSWGRAKQTPLLMLIKGVGSDVGVVRVVPFVYTVASCAVTSDWEVWCQAVLDCGDQQSTRERHQQQKYTVNTPH